MGLNVPARAQKPAFDDLKSQRPGLNLGFNNLSKSNRRRLGILALLILATGTGILVFRWYWTHRFDSLITATAQRHSLDPALVKAVVYEESFFSPRAHSPQNAVGLMQVTPVVAQHWIEATRSHSLSEAVGAIPGQPAPVRELGFEEAFNDPAVSLYVGCWYLQSLINRYKDGADPLAFSLAAYNAGPTNVDRWAPEADRGKMSREEFIARIEFPATRSYVQKIIQRYDAYRRAGEIGPR